MTVLPSTAERFLCALTGEDPDAVSIAPGAVAWHNLDGVEHDLRAAMADFPAARRHLPDLRYDELRCNVADDGVSLARFVLKASLPGGTELRAPGCLVITEHDGAIVRTEEYLDSAQLSPLAAALGRDAG
ncbi:MAG: nuclear transport factor 2 family protein [Ilumatobacteraceae bacterium]